MGKVCWAPGSMASQGLAIKVIDWSKIRSSQGLSGVNSATLPKLFQMGSVLPISW